jgi:hypothetical protein
MSLVLVHPHLDHGEKLPPSLSPLLHPLFDLPLRPRREMRVVSAAQIADPAMPHCHTPIVKDSSCDCHARPQVIDVPPIVEESASCCRRSEPHGVFVREPTGLATGQGADVVNLTIRDAVHDC